MTASHASAVPLALALAVALAGALGCGGTVYQYADTVTPAGGGAFWVAGSEGFAGFSNGGALVRRDYPEARGAPDGIYAPNSIVPGARVVMIGGEPYLFTRHGDVLRPEPGGWRGVPVRFPSPDGGSPQLDFVALAPNGELFFQMHPDLLLWIAPAELGRATFRTERTPGFLPWIGYVDGTLYGLGWQGDARVLQRRTGPGAWEVVEVLGGEGQIGDVRAVIRLPGGPLAVVTSRGLLRVGGVPAGRVVLTDDLLAASTEVGGAPGAAVTVATAAAPPAGAPSAPVAASVAAPSAGASTPPVAAPSVARGSGAVAPGAGAPGRGALQVAGGPPPLAVVAGPEAEGARAVSSFVYGVFETPGAGTFLLLTGTRSGLLQLTAGAPLFHPCDRLGSAVAGLVAGPAGLRAVTQEGVVVDVDAPGGCRLLQAAAPRVVR